MQCMTTTDPTEVVKRKRYIALQLALHHPDLVLLERRLPTFTPIPGEESESKDGAGSCNVVGHSQQCRRCSTELYREVETLRARGVRHTLSLLLQDAELTSSCTAIVRNIEK